MKAVLSEKGQIVIPKEIREKFNFKKGAVFNISVKNDSIVLKFIGMKDKNKDWKKFKGMLKNKYSIEEFLIERKKDREKED